MQKSQLKFLKIYFFISFLMIFQNQINAIQLTTELYTKETVPEIYKQNSPDGGLFCTIIKLEGWPANSTVSFQEKRVGDKKINYRFSFKTPEKGTMPVALSSIGYEPAEPVTFIFKDSKKRISEEITTIPYPISAISLLDGAKLELISTGENSFYKVKLNGFKKNEELFLRINCSNSCSEEKFSYNPDNFVTFSARSEFEDGGIAKVSITRTSGEKLMVELPWGLEKLRYMLYYDEDGKVKSIAEDQKFLNECPKAKKYFSKKL